MSDNKRTKAQVESLILLLVTVGVFGATNAITAIGRYQPKDMTANQRYTVSKGTGNLLTAKETTQKIKIEVFVTKGLPILNTFVGDLTDLLKQYKQLGGDKFAFEIIETKDEDSKKKAKEAGEGAPGGPLAEMEFNIGSKTDTTQSSSTGYMGMVIHYGDDKDTIPQLQPGHSDGLEFWISTKIQELRDRGEKISHKIGVVSGKDELKLSDTHLVPGGGQGKPSLQAIMSQHFKSYEVKDVDLKGGESEIDDALDGLIITQPGKEYTEKELRRIDQFVMKGKSLAVFASAVNTKQGDATMAVTLNSWGLEKLLVGYGIKLEKNVLFDYRSPIQFPVMTQGGPAQARLWYVLQSLDHPAFEKNTRLLDVSFPAFFRLQPLALPMLSSLSLDNAKQPGTNLRAVVRTSDSALAVTEPVELDKYQPKKSDKPSWAQHIVGAALEGDKVKSAFVGGDAQGVTAPGESAKPARVLVLASSQFLTNPLARAGAGQDMSQYGPQFAAMGGGGDKKLEMLAGPYAQQYLTNTILTLKNTLMWMSGDTDLIAVSGKIVAEPALSFGDSYKPSLEDTDDAIKKKFDEIRESHKSRQTTIQWSLIIGVPLLFVLLGLIRWQLRVYSRTKVILA